MQHNEYTTVESYTDDRTINTDPREAAVAYPEHAKIQPQPPKRSPWRVVVLCALALGLAVGIFGLTGGFAFTALQKNLPTRTFSINGHGSLVVNDDSGNFQIHKGTTKQIIVRGSEKVYGFGTNLNNIQVEYAQDGNTVTLTVNEGWSVMGERSVNFDITVPANLDVTIHGNSTDASIENVDGQVNASTSSGDLHLNNINGPLNLNTSSGAITLTGEQGVVSAHSSSGDMRLSNVNGSLNLGDDSGDITITNEQGSVDARTSSGDIRINQLSGPVNLSTDSGNITLDQAQISGQDHLQSSSGDIRFSGTLDPRGSYQMKTDSGNITLNLPASTSFQLSTSTDSGSVRNAFSTPTTGSAPYASVTLKTSSGNIRVQKQ